MPARACVICFEPLPSVSVLSKLASVLHLKVGTVMACGHDDQFHTDCLNKWLHKTSQCPLCRTPVPSITEVRESRSMRSCEFFRLQEYAIFSWHALRTLTRTWTEWGVLRMSHAANSCSEWILWYTTSVVLTLAARAVITFYINAASRLQRAPPKLSCDMSLTQLRAVARSMRISTDTLRAYKMDGDKLSVRVHYRNALLAYIRTLPR